MLLKSKIINLAIKWKWSQNKKKNSETYIKYTSVVNKKIPRFKTVDHLGVLMYKK